MSASAEEVKRSIKIYLGVFGALAVLTVATVMATRLHMGIAAGIALALLIASVKGTLVASYFMHLIHERTALYWILGLCAIFFVSMIMLPVLQTTETVHLMDPIYKAAGETRPLPTPAPARSYGAGHEGHGESAETAEGAAGEGGH
ncbi:MAG TPA: cytochrome C oxidase subunit IV family protein [Phycisphaerae bacterium]|nr:cytochrome C oxidase subunit IV family protein [Phycisphaerales bacterium]HRX84445.1 cytochrome C oxidase subunit IV family protein [Phycisphaerae bacterium]